NVHLNYNGDPQTLTINSNLTWSVTSKPSWLTVSPMSGSNDATISLSSPDNDYYDEPRTGTLVITGGDQVINVNVSQDPIPYLNVSPENSSFGFYGGIETITVSSNQTCSVTKDKSWITVSKSSTTGSSSFTISCAKNSTSADQTGTVTITGGGITRTINVTQEGQVLTISPSSMTFEPEGQSKTLTISSNINWTVSEAYSWITLNKTSGSNNSTVSITVANYTGTSNRTATITVSGEGITQTMNLTQYAPYINTEHNNSVVYDFNSHSNDFSVSSNVNWSMSNIPSWVSISPHTAEDAIVSYTVSKNTGTTQRTATITLSGNGASESIIIKQNGQELTASASSVNLDWNGTSQNASINSNLSWSVTSKPSWLTVSPSSGTNDGSVSISASSNNDVETRQGTLVIGGENRSVSISISQDPEPVLTVSPTSYNFPYNGGNKTISVSSNVSYTISKSKSWISISKTSGTGNSSFTISCVKNPTAGSQSGTVTVTGGGLTRTITVTQTGPSLTVSPTSLSYLTAGGTKTVTITSNTDWTITDNRSWVSTSKTSGSNNSSFTVTLTNNSTGATRTGTVTLTGGGLTRTVSVSQSGDFTTVSPTSLSYGAPSSSKTITVSSNGSWSATSIPSWITVSPASGTGNKTVTVTSTNLTLYT
ncbi:BACON domain-containing protein, partial [Bacteroidota bacterium]